MEYGGEKDMQHHLCPYHRNRTQGGVHFPSHNHMSRTTTEPQQVGGCPRLSGLTGTPFGAPVPNSSQRNTRIPGVGGNRELNIIHGSNDDPGGYGQLTWIYEDLNPLGEGGGGALAPNTNTTATTDHTHAATVDGIGIPNHAEEPIEVLGWVHHGENGEVSGSAQTQNAGPQTPADARATSGPTRKKRSRAAMRIASLNMRGGGQRRSGPKWDYINQIIRDGGLSMIALQETHLTETRLEELQAQYKRLKIFNSPDSDAPSRRGGVGLVLNTSRTKWNNAECSVLKPGRAIQVKIEWGENTYLTVAAIYAPSGNDAENLQLWNDLCETWRTGDAQKPDILLGDLNMVDCALDRLPARPDDEGVVTAFHQAMMLCNLVDGWRASNPTALEYTFATNHSDRPNSRSRIDRIYVRENLLDQCDEWHIEESGIRTDHKMVSTYLAIKDVPFVGKGRSTIPDFILDYKMFRDVLITRGAELDRKMQELKDHPERRTMGFNAQTVWKAFKAEVMEKAREFLRNRATDLDAQIEKWEERRKEVLQTEHESTEPLEATTALLDEIDDNIRELTAARLMRTRNAIAARFLVEGESGNKYDHARHRELKPRDTIVRLKQKPLPPCPGRRPPPPLYERTTRGMVRIATDYHSELQEEFSHTLSRDEWDRETDEVLSRLKPRLDAREAACVGADISAQDVRDAIKAINNGKAPGLDGMPVEVLKFMLNGHNADETAAPDGTKSRPTTEIADTLAVVLNDIVHHGIAEGTHFAEGWLCPLYKKNDKCEISNYRPITVLNTDYKVLTKILTERIARTAPRLIHPDQAGFIRGRSIFDQTELIRLVLDAGDKGNAKGAIVCLDQEKAYDKIRHDFLWKTLEKMGFPETTINTIRTLYESAETSVILNGVIGEKFRIVRGVRQGDPLSCLLFDLAIESLAEMLRTSGLMGMHVEGADRPLVSMLFADDTTVFLHERDAPQTLFNTLVAWCRVSGARFNINKTIFIPIGEEEYRQQVRETRRLHPSQVVPIEDDVRIAEDGQPVRILGAFYGYNVDPDEIWKPVLEKTRLTLDRWARSKPTIRGRTIGNNAVVGGYSQYLTHAQGLPDSALKALLAMTDDFVNAKDGEEKQNRIGRDTLSSKVPEGGVNVLDLAARRDAIELTKAQKLLAPTITPDHPAPLWTNIGMRTLAHYATEPYRKVGSDFLIHPFLQTWKVNVNAKGLPDNLKRMMKAAYKYNVALVVNAPNQTLRKAMPYWYHVGTKATLASKYHNKWGKCQRTSHGVKTVGDMLAHTCKSNNEWCEETEGCECPTCEDDRLLGCDSPQKCRKDAALKLDNLRPEWDPRKWPSAVQQQDDALPPLPEGYKKTHKLGLEPVADPAKLLRVFTDPDIPLREHILPEHRSPPPTAQVMAQGRQTRAHTRSQQQAPAPAQLPAGETVEVYTDGSCFDNGTRDARCGSGLWYGHNDERNQALRVGLEEKSNNVGELVAILVAIQSHRNASRICISTDSQYAMDAVTTRAEEWADRGFVDTKNKKIVQALLAEIQGTTSDVLIRKVKGHSGDAGNDGADEQANEGANKATEDVINLVRGEKIAAAGGKLQSLTQALAYRAMRLRKQAKLRNRKTTEENLALTSATIEEITGVNHTPESIWRSLHQRKRTTLIQKFSAFAWRAVHGAQKVGEYWLQVGNDEWAPCELCGVQIESMRHILFECRASGQEVIWNLARTAWASAGVEWPHISLGVILGAGLMEVKRNDGKKLRGKSRLLQILVSESAYLIWLIRNEWRIEYEQDPSKLHTKQEIENRWWATINKRRTLDWALTNKRAYGRKALAKKDVDNTWDGVPNPTVRNDAVRAGVIVGRAQSRRPPGRNR